MLYCICNKIMRKLLGGDSVNGRKLENEITSTSQAWAQFRYVRYFTSSSLLGSATFITCTVLFFSVYSVIQTRPTCTSDNSVDQHTSSVHGYDRRPGICWEVHHYGGSRDISRPVLCHPSSCDDCRGRNRRWRHRFI